MDKKYVLSILLLIGIVFLAGCISSKDKCANIANQTIKDSCYGVVAENTSNPTLCGKITNQSLKDDCYRITAINTNDTSLCEKITDNLDKSNCYRDLESNGSNETLNNKSNSCYNDSDCSIENKVCYKNQCVQLSAKIQCERAGQFWCDENGPCYDGFVGYCTGCLGKALTTCTCLDQSGNQKIDGSDCYTSELPGKCLSGTCVAERPGIKPEGTIKIGLIELQFQNSGFSSYFKDCNGYLQDNLQSCDGPKKYDYMELINNPAGFTDIEDKTGNRVVHSLYFIDDWYEQQAERFGVNLDISLDMKGPIQLSEEPPERSRTDNCYFNDFFENSARNAGVRIEDYDVILFIYFDDAINGPRFVSCYNSPNTAYVDAPINIWVANDELTLVSALHELGHAFGMVDHYINYQCDTEGITNEPHTACLSCITCPNSDCGHDLMNGNALSSQLEVCSDDAKRFGWSN